MGIETNGYKKTEDKRNETREMHSMILFIRPEKLWRCYQNLNRASREEISTA
jgi:hypothetical protein